MFIADDILAFPFKSILRVFREIYNAAVQEMDDEADEIRNELSQLYLRLEAGEIDEATFDGQERRLLDRLDVIESRELAEVEDSDEPEDDEAAEALDDECQNDDYDEDEDVPFDYVYEPPSDQVGN